MTARTDHAEPTITIEAMPSPGRRWARAIGAVVVALIAGGLIAAGTWASYWAPNRNDQYQLLLLGRNVFEGGRMYVDIWENKPPGIAWINALGFVLGAGNPIGAWVLPGVFAAAALALLAATVTRVLSAMTAAVTALLAAFVVAMRPYDTPSIHPDFYAAALELMAGSMLLMALLTTGDWHRRALALLAGLFWAAALSINPTGVTGLIALTLVGLLVLAAWRPTRRRWMAVIGLTWAGFVSGVAVVVGVLALRGTLAEAWSAAVVFNRELLSIAVVPSLWHLWAEARASLAFLWLPLLLALTGLVGTVYAGRANRMSPAFLWAMLIWWIAQVALVSLGPSGSMRYWQATFPPMLLAVAFGVYHVEALFREVQPPRRGALIVLVLAVVVALGRPGGEAFIEGLAGAYLEYTDEEGARDRLAQIGARVAELTGADDRIYVWAYESGVYVHADRVPASRYTYPRSAAQMDEILTALENGKCRLLLMPENGSPSFEPWCDDACASRLKSAIASFKISAGVDDYEFWVYQPVPVSASVH